MPLLFNTPPLKQTAREMIESFSLDPGHYLAKHFADKELLIELLNEVKYIETYALGTIAPPNEQMVEFFLLCHTLKKEQSAKVTAILPYLAYTRQDKNEPLRSLATDWISNMFKASGIDEVVTIDIHNELVKGFFHMPLVSLSPANLWAKTIKEVGFEDAVIVAPDEGAIDRAEKVRHLLGKEEPLVYFKKQRFGESVVSTLHGEVGAKAVVIDDILDTGATLIACCDALQKAGVQKIIVMVTHGLFTGDLWPGLYDSSVINIFTTDTVPSAKQKASRQITVLSAIPILKEHLKQ